MSYPDNEISAEQRERIIAALPPDWSQDEIDAFISTYAVRIQEPEVVTPPEQMDPPFLTEIPMTGSPEQPAPLSAAQQSPMPVSRLSRGGLTLDSYIILEGRSVPLRALWEAGRLVTLRPRFLFEGARLASKRVIQYEARLVDLPKYFVITEETYRVMSPTTDQMHPHDEPLTLRQAANVQAGTTIVEADELDGRKDHA